MKYFLLLILFLSINIFSQAQNKIIKDENSEPVLIGYCTREVFSDSVFAPWFSPEYDNYKSDSASVSLLKENMNNVDITLVFGTWCDDSKQHVPHLYKILDEINYPAEEMKLIAVNEDKKTEGDEIEDLNIEFVPVIILYRNNLELGRIVEMPSESIEEDIVGILLSRNLINQVPTNTN